MQEFVRLNYSIKDLQRLNRVQSYQEVLFLSNVMDASSRALDKNISGHGNRMRHGQLSLSQKSNPQQKTSNSGDLLSHKSGH